VKLSDLAVELCVLIPETANNINLHQICLTIKGMQCGNCCHGVSTSEHMLMISSFLSLNYFCAPAGCRPSTIVQDVINNCQQLRCAHFSTVRQLSLNLTRNHNLQQLYIDSPDTVVFNDFMTSVSAHGGLVHVVMMVRCVRVRGLTSLLRNSPKLITLYLHVSVLDVDAEHANLLLNKLFWERRFLTAGCYKLFVSWVRKARDVLWKQGTDLLPL